MDLYKLIWKSSAKKELKKINRSDIPRIITAVEMLAQNPFPVGYKKYQGAKYVYRIRVGNYRIIYTAWQKELTICIMKVGHRQSIYKP